jgi:phospholipid transport system transporter-binding protein
VSATARDDIAPPAATPGGFALPAALTMDEAAEVLRGVEQALRAVPAAGALRIDASALAELDTGAIALLLQARRLATSRGLGFELAAVPDKLAALARLYGVATLLGIAGDDKAESRAAAAG